MKKENREIKFRGQRVDNEEFITGGSFVENSNGECFITFGDLMTGHAPGFEPPCYELSNSFEVIPETIGQYTGLKDKNNVEIYEGDILHNNKDNYPYYYQVVYHHGKFMVLTKNYGYRDLFEYKSLIIVGNIHQNPELLKVKTQN